MKNDNYAVIDNTGKVINVTVWDGESEWTPPEDTIAIKLDSSGAGIGWTYKGGTFTPPPLTQDEINMQKQHLVSSNISMKQSLIEEATKKIAILQDAADLDMATGKEVNLLPMWKKYRVLLSRVDANTSDEIAWPAQPS